eukprot:scaffold241962_cov16-Prasinocladus_malaysianus.AAC.1
MRKSDANTITDNAIMPQEIEIDYNLRTPQGCRRCYLLGPISHASLVMPRTIGQGEMPRL